MATAEEAMQSAKSAHHRIDALETEVKDIRSVTNAVARLDEKVDGVKGDIVEIKDDVKSLSAVPADRWNRVVAAVITAIVSGLAGAIIALVIK